MTRYSINLRTLLIALAGGLALSGCTEPRLAESDPLPFRVGRPFPAGYEPGARSEAVIKMTSGAQKGDEINVTYDAVTLYPEMAHRFIFKDGMTLTVNLAAKQAFVFYPHAKKVHSFPYDELPRHPNGEPDILKTLGGVLGGDVTLLREADPPIVGFPSKELALSGPKATLWSTTPEGKAINLVVLVHGCCTDAKDLGWWYALADEIAGEINKRKEARNWEIVVFDWHANTREPFPGPAYESTLDESLRLSLAIAQLPHPYKYIHFIGHSTGARLIDLAAKRLAKHYNGERKNDPPFMHLTFLDAYAPFGEGERGYGYLDDYPAHYSEHYVDRGRILIRTTALRTRLTST